MKKVLLILAIAVTGMVSAQDMEDMPKMPKMESMEKMPAMPDDSESIMGGMIKISVKEMPDAMIMHGDDGFSLASSEALITLGTTGKVAAFVRECLENGVDAKFGFTPSPFSAGKINYTDLSPVKLLNMKELEMMAGVNGFAPETANLTVNGVNYTIRMVGPVVHKDNFVVQGGGWAARYDLGQDEGEYGGITLVKKVKISKMNMR